MKLKKLLKLMDPIFTIVLWTSDDKDKPSFIGAALDIPWFYLDYTIGRLDDSTEEPILLVDHISKTESQPGLIINLIPPKEKR